jgi:phage tail tape-measure protein
VVTRSQAEKYRELARECRRLAGTVSTEDGRVHLTAMAEVWERLVDQQEQGSDLGDAPASRSPASEAPVVQQQQQAQPKHEDKDD